MVGLQKHENWLADDKNHSHVASAAGHPPCRQTSALCDLVALICLAAHQRCLTILVWIHCLQQMPVYDPRAREQFRQAALGRPARGRRASCDSGAASRSVPGKLLLSPSQSTASLSPTKSHPPSSPQPPNRDHKHHTKRRSSLAPTTWLNSNPLRMYQKLPQEPRSPLRSLESIKTPELKIEDHAQLEDEFSHADLPGKLSLPDIGLPITEHMPPRSPKPLISPPAIPPVPEDEDEEEEEETSLTNSLLSESQSQRDYDYAQAALRHEASIR